MLCRAAQEPDGGYRGPFWPSGAVRPGTMCKMKRVRAAFWDKYSASKTIEHLAFCVLMCNMKFTLNKVNLKIQ
jgi:hypothetical protein